MSRAARCRECFDPFHYDDCGGYNPPCPCGCGRCRSCCDAAEMERTAWADNAEDAAYEMDAFPDAGAP